jgi:hypothetical protein
MSNITASILVSVCIFAGGIIGLNLHRVLPRQHLTKETTDVIKLGTGMLSVLASLVLGLLIATAKTSRDSTQQSIQTYAAELALLNEVLRDYGGAATTPHKELRAYVTRFLTETWPANGDSPVLGSDQTAQVLLEHVREAIRALKPTDDGQTTLRNEALGITTNLLRQRWLLIERQGPNVQGVVLIVLVSWVSAIFVSFGLNAPRNATVVGAFLVCSIAIGASIFLVLEMDRPLGGTLRISQEPINAVLEQLNW